MDKVCAELVQFMQLSTRLDLKLNATRNILSLTASPEGRKLIIEQKALLEAILKLTKDEMPMVVEDCYNSLVNLSSEDHVADVILADYNIIPEFFRVICDATSKFSDKACMIISNLTRTSNGCQKVAENISEIGGTSEKDQATPTLEQLLTVFCKAVQKESNATLNYLATFFSNLTQLPEGRQYFLDPGQKRIQKLFPFLKHDSLTRRGGVAATLRNCCFEYESHPWLLSGEVDILSHILLPLAGNEEFTDEENDLLPIDLQYLPSDKVRESDPDIRKILVETVMLLCADKPGRLIVKEKKAYLIIRELHNWEKKNGPEENGEACEKLIQILISDEPEEGMENLLTCEIPEKYKKILEETQ